jgi:serine/threonine-protein kinase
VPKDPGAELELLFADNLAASEYIIPIWGVGEIDGFWILLMPRAEKSLRRHLADVGRPLQEAEALPIVADVLQALVSINSAGVIHRDLKPENVLLYSDRWCLSDFGIARYVGAATRLDTRKYSTTRPYAAPEQWRDEDASPVTDVYALGVMCHELLAGSLPYPGPDFRHQHLHHDPPAIATVATPLATLVQECLIKAPGARPEARDALDRLERRAYRHIAASQGLAALQAANLAVTREKAQTARRESEAQSRRERRRDLIHAAHMQFDQITDQLKQTILEAAPGSAVRPEAGWTWKIVLGGSIIGISDAYETNDEWLGKLKFPFDVLLHACIAVGRPDHEYSGRAHSLWYCDVETHGRYGWYETAFVGGDQEGSSTAFRGHICRPYYERLDFGHGRYHPIAAPPHDATVLLALDETATLQHVEWPLTLLDALGLDDFINRWASWLAASSQGLLRRRI